MSTPCCARLLRGPLGLDALLAALRRFFWQDAGDWAAALTGALCRAAALARPLGAPELQALLDEALRVCTGLHHSSSDSCCGQTVLLVAFLSELCGLCYLPAFCENHAATARHLQVFLAQPKACST